MRFYENVTAISPVGSSTNSGKEKSSPETSEKPLRRENISTKPLSPPAETEDPDDFDFDWEGRRANSLKSNNTRNKLRRRKNRSFDSGTSDHSNMSSKEGGSGTGEPERNNSMTSSLKSMVSSLKKVKTSNSQNSETSQVSPLDDLSDLPGTREGLEGRLNYHLSELDRLRKYVRARNEEMKEEWNRLTSQEHRLEREMPGPYKKGHEMVSKIREARDNFAPFVGYHQNEIRRIARKRKELDESQGLPSTVQEMYKGFERTEEWLQLFSV